MSHAVRSERPESAKSRVVIWFFRSTRHGCKVREKVHTMQRLFLNLWVTNTLATQIKINSQRLQYSPSSLFSFFFFFFRPFQHPEPRAPCLTSTAENPSYQTTNKSYLLLPRDPECDQAYYFLIVPLIPMTGPCIILLTLRYIDYGQLKKVIHFYSSLMWLGWKVGTDTSGIFSLT
jgi:hypothetical protein